MVMTTTFNNVSSTLVSGIMCSCPFIRTFSPSCIETHQKKVWRVSGRTKLRLISLVTVLHCNLMKLWSDSYPYGKLCGEVTQCSAICFTKFFYPFNAQTRKLLCMCFISSMICTKWYLKDTNWELKLPMLIPKYIKHTWNFERGNRIGREITETKCRESLQHLYI